MRDEANETPYSDAPSLDIGKDDRIRYHMAEYASLKSEIGALNQQIVTHLTYGIAVSAGVFAWLILREPEWPIMRIARFLPLFASVLFMALSIACHARIEDRQNYIKRLESRFAARELGWEAQPKSRRRHMGRWYLAGWIFLGLGNFAAAVTLFDSSRGPAADTIKTSVTQSPNR